MLNVRSIAVQGIGFAVVALALQGFASSVGVPPTEAIGAPGGVGPAPTIQEVKRKIRGLAKRSTPSYASVAPRLVAKGKAHYIAAPASIDTYYPSFTGYGRAKVSYAVNSFVSFDPSLKGEGVHNLSDSEIAAMVLLLLGI